MAIYHRQMVKELIDYCVWWEGYRLGNFMQSQPGYVTVGNEDVTLAREWVDGAVWGSALPVGEAWDLAGLRGLGFRLGMSVDVKVYWPDVFSGSAIAFALGLYDRAAWGRGLVNYRCGDVLILCWGEEQYLLAWVELCCSLALWA